VVQGKLASDDHSALTHIQRCADHRAPARDVGKAKSYR
jgi:hypothetical protein